MMRLDSNGRKLIEQWEGRSNTAYLDTGGVWTIGIGHAIKPNEQHLRTATLSDAEVDALFTADVAWAEEAVRDLFPGITRQSQFNALVSFVFNLGASQVASSTLRQVINAKGSAEDIRAQWMRWVNDNGQRVQGLVNRRAAEVREFFRYQATAVVVCLILAAACLGIVGTNLLA